MKLPSVGAIFPTDGVQVIFVLHSSDLYVEKSKWIYIVGICAEE